MGKLILIRHGQASAGSDDYDQLSALGYQQGRRLGARWADAMPPPDKVYVGSLRRHHQTLDAVEESFRQEAADKTWPDREELPAFDEYDAYKLLHFAVPHMIERDDALRQQVEEATAQGSSLLKGGLFWKLFALATRRWVNGSFNAPGVPRWTDFYDRVVAGVEEITSRSQGGEDIAVFTSGGPIAVAFGHSLGLDGTQILELSWRIYNASLTTFLFSKGRLSINQLNTIPHLAPAEQSLR